MNRLITTMLLSLICFSTTSAEDVGIWGKKLRGMMDKADTKVQERIASTPALQRGIERGVNAIADNTTTFVKPDATKDEIRLGRAVTQMMLDPREGSVERGLDEVMAVMTSNSDSKMYRKPVTITREFERNRNVYRDFKGIIGWWMLDEGAGSTIHDNGRFGFDGKVLGHAQWVSRDGVTGLRLGGDFARVRLPDINLNSGDFTIEAFVYSYAPRNQNSVFFAGDSNTGNVGLYGAVQNGKVRFYIRPPRGTAMNLWSKYPEVNQNQWNHIVWSKRGRYASVYVNGKEIKMTSQGLRQDQAPDVFQNYSAFYIGSKASTERQSSYDGVLRGVRIMNYAIY